MPIDPSASPDAPPQPAPTSPSQQSPGGGGDVMIQLPKSQFDQIMQLVNGLAQAFQQIAQEVEGQKQQQEGAPAQAGGDQSPNPGGDEDFLQSIAQAGSQ